MQNTGRTDRAIGGGDDRGRAPPPFANQRRLVNQFAMRPLSPRQISSLETGSASRLLRRGCTNPTTPTTNSLGTRASEWSAKLAALWLRRVVGVKAVDAMDSHSAGLPRHHPTRFASTGDAGPPSPNTRGVRLLRFRKKRGDLAVAQLAKQLLEQTRREYERAGQFPAEACYVFDALNDELNDYQTDDQMGQTAQNIQDDQQSPSSTVQKTCRRPLVTLAFGAFEAREVVRQTSCSSATEAPVGDDRENVADSKASQNARVMRSKRLAGLAPPKCKYGYDLIAEVGLSSFLHGQRIADIQRELANRSPAVWIPTSTLDELRRRFLYHLGRLHQHAAPTCAEYFREQAGYVWSLDGTLEPGTPVYFGVFEVGSGIMLSCRKIATEASELIEPLLEETRQGYGIPQRVLLDLSVQISQASQSVFPDVPHWVCHYHFCHDIGEDLYRQPNQALLHRLQSWGLQLKLCQQRQGQTAWLRNEGVSPHSKSQLERLLRGESLTLSEPRQGKVVYREILLALHAWMLDYRADGQREGFPFDPYQLYYHRRLIRGRDALQRLLGAGASADVLQGVRSGIPRVLYNLRDQLTAYGEDAEIRSAAAHYEQAYEAFGRLRSALRLHAAGPSPMRTAYPVTAEERQEVGRSLKELRAEAQERSQAQDEVESQVYGVIARHLEKYWTFLGTDGGSTVIPDRTTQQQERHWGSSKRDSRRRQGGGKLTRAFCALPAELMLVLNLDNPTYVQLVLEGDLSNLALKFAATTGNASDYCRWRRAETPLNVGRLPRRILRQEDFVDRLINTCLLVNPPSE